MNSIKKITDWYFSKKALPYWVILILDCIIVAFSGFFTTYLQVGAQYFIEHFSNIALGVLISSIPYVISFRIFHTYSGIIRYSSFRDLLRVISATTLGSFLTFIIVMGLWLFEVESIEVPGIIHGLLAYAICTLLMWLMRMVVRAAHEGYRTADKTQRVFIYGVQSGGIGLAKGLLEQDPIKYELAGFVSPDGDLESNFLMGVKVRRDGPNLVRHIRKANAKVMLVSPLQTERFTQRTELIDALIDANIKILMMPPAEEWDGKSNVSSNQLHEVDIEELLPRDKIDVDMAAIGNMLRGKRILITGAAGSIGSEMSRQVAKFNPSSLILIDQAETPMHDVRLYMKRKHSDLHVETIVTSICRQERMEQIFEQFRPEYVFHAAAYKHVPMMEDNPSEAVQNNIYGTRVIADLAVKYGTKKFVMISTDKAVNPTNVMGCSKRICEIYCQALNQSILDGTCPIKPIDDIPAGEGCQFVTTRFGNVLGSNGSVIPIFKEQIRKGGPVMVTHPDIIRFFMLIPEACRLVLEAGTMGHGGEIFVFDMGKPVRILDLAKRMIQLSGAKNVKVEFSGLRDGEKLYEEVLSDAETTLPTHHPKIKVAQVREVSYDQALSDEKELLELSYSFNDMEVVRKMKEIVPEYKSQHSKYEELDKK